MAKKSGENTNKVKRKFSRYCFRVARPPVGMTGSSGCPPVLPSLESVLDHSVTVFTTAAHFVHPLCPNPPWKRKEMRHIRKTFSGCFCTLKINRQSGNFVGSLTGDGIVLCTSFPLYPETCSTCRTYTSTFFSGEALLKGKAGWPGSQNLRIALK